MRLVQLVWSSKFLMASLCFGPGRLQAFKAANQAIGRLIRNTEDYGGERQTHMDPADCDGIMLRGAGSIALTAVGGRPSQFWSCSTGGTPASHCG